jgi:AcrR family transcriptional regulator
MPPPTRAPRRLSPRKRPVQRRSKETVRAILEAAAQVLEREGLEGATTDRIAERAGVSIGSLYQYFPSKQAIVLALAQCHVLETWQWIEPAFERLGEVPPLSDVLRDFVRGTVAVHRARPRLHRVLFEDAPRPPAIKAAMEQAERWLAERVARYFAAAPDVEVRDPALAAHLVLTALFALVHQLPPPAGGDAATPHAEDEIVRLLERYLARAAADA